MQVTVQYTNNLHKVDVTESHSHYLLHLQGSNTEPQMDGERDWAIDRVKMIILIYVTFI